MGAVVRVALGNFLEMYDFMVFGYYAAAIGRAFFPAQNEYASLMLALMTFGTGRSAGRLHRPPRTPQGPAADTFIDGYRDAFDRRGARL